VHGQHGPGGLREVEEGGGDACRRRGAVLELQIVVTDAELTEFGGVVLWLVEAHDVRHPEVSKDLRVVFGAKLPVAPLVINILPAAEILWALESHELVRNYLVNVAVERVAVMIVFMNVDLSTKSGRVWGLDPSQRLTPPKTPPTVLKH
jgi:hypothetical protein